MPEPAPTPRRLVGTAQYPDAQDLSPYLIHMTRTHEDLAEILVDGCIEARGSFGLAGQNESYKDTHRSVCLTETPASELQRFTSKRPYGLVFSREFILNQGGQRVWYLNYGTETFKAFTHEINRLRPLGDKSRLFELTPFIDVWRQDGYAFDWEREWRVNGNVRFEWSDVEFLITPDKGLLTIEERPEIGSSYYHPDHEEYIWTGGTLPSLDDAVSRLADQFQEHYVHPEEELFYDPDDPTGYAWGANRCLETWEAVESAFEGRPQQVLDALTRHFDGVSAYWLARSDL